MKSVFDLNHFQMVFKYIICVTCIQFETSEHVDIFTVQWGNY